MVSDPVVPPTDRLGFQFWERGGVLGTGARDDLKSRGCDLREGEAPADPSSGKDVILQFGFGGSLSLPFAQCQQCVALAGWVIAWRE